MFPSRTKLLNRIYNHTLKTGEPLSLSLDDETSPEYRLTDQIQKDIDYLTDNGYVKDEYDIIGSAHLVLTEKGEQFVENERAPQKKSETQSPVFNFNAPVTGNAIIGTQENVTQNVSCSLPELETLFSQRPNEEQEQLNEILDLLRNLQKDEPSLPKHTCGKIMDFLSKHIELKIPIALTLFQHFIG